MRTAHSNTRLAWGAIFSVALAVVVNSCFLLLMITIKGQIIDRASVEALILGHAA